MRRLLLRVWLVVLVALLIAASIAVAWLAVHWPTYRAEFL